MAVRCTAVDPRAASPCLRDTLFREGERFHLRGRRRWIPADDLPSRGKVAIPEMNNGWGPCYCCDSSHRRGRRNGGRKRGRLEFMSVQ